MKKTTKNSKNKNSWDKIWVMCGDEYLCNISIFSLIENMSVTNTFYANDNIEDILPYLINFSFLNDQTSILIKEPSIASLKIILSLIENNKIVIPSLIIYLSQSDPESGDFIKEAKKQKRIFSHSYVNSKDTFILKHFISDIWIKNNKVCISPKACLWLIENAPTKIAKISSKKEEEVINLMLLNNELCKIASFNKNIEIEDVKNYCIFNQIINIWDCINAMLLLDMTQAFKQYHMYLQYNNIKLLINILSNQIEFMIEVLSLYKRGITNPVDIQKILSYSDFIIQYPGIECKENSSGTPNLWRIKKTLEKIHIYDITILTKQLNVLRSANIDLQSGADQSLISDYLFFSLKGNAKYNEPFFI